MLTAARVLLSFPFLQFYRIKRLNKTNHFNVYCRQELTKEKLGFAGKVKEINFGTTKVQII